MCKFSKRIYRFFDKFTNFIAVSVKWVTFGQSRMAGSVLWMFFLQKIERFLQNLMLFNP
jgi:hypothetical protein